MNLDQFCLAKRHFRTNFALDSIESINTPKISLGLSCATDNSVSYDDHLFRSSFEGVVAPCCNPLTSQPEQPGKRGSKLTSAFERHDKGSRTRLALSYFM